MRAGLGETLPSWQPGGTFRKFFLMLNLSLLDFGCLVSFFPLCCPWFREHEAVDRRGFRKLPRSGFQARVPFCRVSSVERV